jgi:hypothetical protein
MASCFGIEFCEKKYIIICNTIKVKIIVYIVGLTVPT